MRDEELPAPTSELVAHFGALAPGSPESTDWDVLEDELTDRILRLLTDRPEKLRRTLYILDVPEHHYRDAMALGSLDAAARALARAVLERESAKIESRRRYRGGHLP